MLRIRFNPLDMSRRVANVCGRVYQGSADDEGAYVSVYAGVDTPELIEPRIPLPLDTVGGISSGSRGTLLYIGSPISRQILALDRRALDRGEVDIVALIAGVPFEALTIECDGKREHLGLLDRGRVKFYDLETVHRHERLRPAFEGEISVSAYASSLCSDGAGRMALLRTLSAYSVEVASFQLGDALQVVRTHRTQPMRRCSMRTQTFPGWCDDMIRANPGVVGVSTWRNAAAGSQSMAMRFRSV